MIARAFLLAALPVALLTSALGQPVQPVGTPTIGIIDYYGLHKANADRVRKLLGLNSGDALPKSKSDIEERLEAVDGVVRAHLEAVCCAESKAILYVGILERGDPTFQYREPPQGEMKLPEEIVDTWHAFMEQLTGAIRAGKSDEDLTQGHSLMADANAREQQLKFVSLAEKHLPILREVLRNSIDETERAIAAYIIAYAPNKLKVVDDLQFAMQDPDDGVRNNAMRSLAAFTVLSQKKPELELRISPTWFVEQMNSLLWTDRNKAAFALVTLSESRDPKILDLLKERAVDSMADMARWQHLPHALPGFILLGRTAGWEEQKIQDTWSAGTHRTAVDEILKSLREKKKG